MRRLALIWVLLAALCAGCFGGDEEPATQAPVPTVDDGVSEADAARPASTLVEPLPTRAALAARPGAALRARLDAGAVALVDLEGRMGIEPREVTFASGGRMADVTWSRWDDREAVGRGRMVGVVCEPDCARGRRIQAPATIRLSAPVACESGRYFDRGRIEVASDDEEAESTSWLAAPC